MKILIVGDIEAESNADTMLQKINAISKQYGPFSICLSFADLSDSTVEPALSLYCMNNRVQAQNYDNIVQLKGDGQLKILEGLRVCWIGQFQETTTLQANFCDILLSKAWPMDIEKRSSKPVSIKNIASQASQKVAKTGQTLMPSYHFATGEDVYYEREPFINKNGNATRFIGLGNFGNKLKQRWFYAFSFDSASPQASVSGATLSPYVKDDKIEDQSLVLKRKATAQHQKIPRPGYVCRICSLSGHFVGDCPQKSRRVQQVSSQDCWFCLSNPKSEKQLIVSVGDEVYLTLPKGPLTQQHVLIIPISHVNSQLAIKEDDAMQLEVGKYKAALRQFYIKQDLCVVFFEMAFRSIHMSIQCIPLPMDYIEGDELRNAFVERLQTSNAEGSFNAFSLSSLQPDMNYFYLELPDGEQLVYCIKERTFEVQFGRKVLAEILGTPELADWRTCVNDQARESKLAQEFKAKFKDFDFNI